jgi:hypothetical protein
MKELDEVMARLQDGIVPQPKEIDLIIADIRKRREAHKVGGKRASTKDDEGVADLKKLIGTKVEPKKERMERRI